MHSITVPASMEHLDRVMSAIDEFLTEAGCGEDDKRLIEISAEELFTNIASYAYGGGEGQVWLEWDMRVLKNAQREAVIALKDQGIPYDPFAREDPDLNLSIEKRPVGGLGVYMVKRFMDHAEYQYKEGWNVTVIKKRFYIEDLEEQVFGSGAREEEEKPDPGVLGKEEQDGQPDPGAAGKEEAPGDGLSQEEAWPEDGEPVVITMTMEDGSLMECIVKGVFLEGEKEYIALEQEDGQMVIMELLSGEDDEIRLMPVTEEEEQERAIEAFWEFFGEPDTEETMIKKESENENDRDQDREED